MAANLIRGQFFDAPLPAFPFQCREVYGERQDREPTWHDGGVINAEQPPQIAIEQLDQSVLMRQRRPESVSVLAVEAGPVDPAGSLFHQVEEL